MTTEHQQQCEREGSRSVGAGGQRLSFDEQWPLTAEQLRRLAPAVPFETSLIGVHAAHGEAIENVGTRHRAAYRFVNDYPDGLAVVVSQGGVTFVASREGAVMFWEQSVSP